MTNNVSFLDSDSNSDDEGLECMLSQPKGRDTAWSWKQQQGKTAAVTDLSFGANVIVPPPRKTFEPWKSEDDRSVDFSKFKKSTNPEKKEKKDPTEDKNETSLLTESHTSDGGASTPKRSKLEEKTKGKKESSEKAPVEADDMTIVFPKTSTQMRKSKLPLKRSHELSSDSDLTDDERDDSSPPKSFPVSERLEDETKSSLVPEKLENEAKASKNENSVRIKGESQEHDKKPSTSTGKRSNSSAQGKSTTSPRRSKEQGQSSKNLQAGGRSKSTKDSLSNSGIQGDRLNQTQSQSDVDTKPSSQEIKRERSEASLKAAAAAEKRIQMRIGGSGAASTSG